MCFRPSAVDINKNTQTGECPTCGMPVAADIGVNSGICPYCGDPIPVGTPSQFETAPENNTRIL